MSIEFTGERVVPGQVDVDLWNEHFSRYVYARGFCSGAKVLDAGSGAGYGCASLAETAALAVGFDLANDAVRYAAHEYGRANTRWLQASLTSLPFATASFDVVVAFEVIEHLEQWRDFLFEARRVLTDGGVLLVSTPNKSFYAESRESSGPNPYHTHEFEFDEFRDALKDIFPHVSIALQNHSACVLMEAPSESSARAHVEQRGTPGQANFFLAVCSNNPVDAPTFVFLPRAANVLKERADHIRRLETELSTKNSWLQKSQAEHADLVSLHDNQTAELKANNEWARQLDADLNASFARVADLQRELEEQQQSALKTAGGYEQALQQVREELVARAEWAKSLEKQGEELARCVELLDKAEATVVERTQWAQTAQKHLDEMRLGLSSRKARAWIKLGRAIGFLPELRS